MSLYQNIRRQNVSIKYQHHIPKPNPYHKTKKWGDKDERNEEVGKLWR